MNRLQLIIKRPGSLLSKWLDVPITEAQYQQIVLLLAKPDEYAVMRKPGIGFGTPQQEAQRARS